MARGDVRIAVTMACEDCKRRNYQTNKSRRNSPDRIEMRKYCRWWGHPTAHKETREGQMAKSRAQPKTEPRSRDRQAGSRPDDGRPTPAEAQHETQVPVSGEVAEVEAVEAGIAAGAPESALESPDAPKTSRSERRAEAKRAKEAEKRKREEQKQRERDQIAKKQKQAQADRQRGGVIGFHAYCWAELKKVQWPDRDTLVQATAVTIIFLPVAGGPLRALHTSGE